MDAPTPVPGSLTRRYRLRRVLGAGGFGTVYLAEDQQVGRLVALKLLEVPDPEVRLRFQREARVTAALEHPHVVRVFDSGVTPEGPAFIAYEYVDGSDLAAALDERRLPPEEVMRVGIALAEALHEAHRQGVIHRDVKPANVLLRDGAAPVLTDFGIARVVAGETLATAEGVILGTPAYMAPEVFMGAPPDAAADQFALGATLIEAAGGEGVYPGSDLTEILAAMRAQRPDRFPEVLRGRLGPLEAVLARAVASAPQDRYPDCGAFAAALRGCWREMSDGEVPVVGAPTILLAAPAKVTPTPVRGRPVPPAPRTGAGWWLGVVLVGLLVGWGGLRSRVAPAPAPSPSIAASAPDPEALLRVTEARAALERAQAGLLRHFSEPLPSPGARSYDFAIANARILVDADVAQDLWDFVDGFARWVEAEEAAVPLDRPSPFEGELARARFDEAQDTLARIHYCLKFLTKGAGASRFQSLEGIGIISLAEQRLDSARSVLLGLVEAIRRQPRRPRSPHLTYLAAEYAGWAPLETRLELIRDLDAVLVGRSCDAETRQALLIQVLELMQSVASDAGLGEARCQGLLGLRVDLAAHLERLPPSPAPINRVGLSFRVLTAWYQLRDRCAFVRGPSPEPRLLEAVIRVLAREVADLGVDLLRAPAQAEILRDLRDRPPSEDVRAQQLRDQLTAYLDG